MNRIEGKARDIQICMFMDNSKMPKANLSDLTTGNPGVGGTEYVMMLLALKLASETGINLVFNSALAMHENFPLKTNVGVFDSEYLRNNIFDLVVLRNDEFSLNLITGMKFESNKTRFLVWCHNPIDLLHAELMSISESVVAVVMPSNTQRNLWIDRPIAKKLYVLPNLYPDKPIYESKHQPKLDVAFIGGIVPEKGFHILSEIWPKISKSNPHSKLRVIGSPDLYKMNRDFEPITGHSYFHYCQDLLREYQDSVIFMGKLSSREISCVLSNHVAVGVVNPLGNETFCLSALDFQKHGIPVVTRNKGAVVEIVVNSKTGYLVSGKSGLRKRIDGLLKNPELASKQSIAAINNVALNFNIEKISNCWIQFITDIARNHPVPLQKIKVLRIKDTIFLINRYVRRSFIKPLPILQIQKLLQTFFSKKIKNIFDNFH